jgi:hypothetical protein
MVMVHCGHSLVLGAAAVSGCGFLVQRFTCCTKINTQNATIKKLITVFKNRP